MTQVHSAEGMFLYCFNYSVEKVCKEQICEQPETFQLLNLQLTVYFARLVERSTGPPWDQRVFAAHTELFPMDDTYYYMSYNNIHGHLLGGCLTELSLSQMIC